MADFIDCLSRNRLDSVLKDAAPCCSDPSQVSVLEVRGPTGFSSSPSIEPRTESLSVSFVSATRGEDGLHVHVNPDVMKLLHEKAGLTAKFLVDFYETHDWTVFPTSSVTHASNSTLALQYGFWVWRTESTHSFTQLITDSNTATYFCINIPPSLKDRIFDAVKSSPSLACMPFFIDMLILDDLLASYRVAITDQRASLRAVERDMDSSTIESRTKKLHVLAVKWHTILKDLADIQQHIQHLRSISTSKIPPRTDSTNPSSQPSDSSPGEVFQLMESTCLFWSRWVTAYLERTNIRINLMHNLAAQIVSSETTNIALQTQRDSVSMFTLAMVTATFLPGTFVCSVLSTVFFSFDGTAFAISHWWWTLPMSAVPLTGLVIYVWFMWFRTKLSHDKVELQSRKVEVETGSSTASLTGQK
ncbi:hypothetical protein OIDMADRAFT_27483 [Oidiodendron maius Zn]|uniref:Uncharacterized protein n=1 Tax=Oidiodendron maius (strain Zn) TaxID=913774 RepID=A0A0C3HIV4_OIDMZ|nr:hypothetical protein OIDMADRAFT_27483 [Oidiodendron maius Zn]